MYRSIAVFACLFAIVASQTVTLLSTGTTSAVLAPVASSSEAEYPQLFYKIWVPENVESLTVDLTQTGTTCTGDIRANFHGSHIPCGSKWSEGSNNNFPCRAALTDYFTDTSPTSWTIYPSEANAYKVTAGSYAYFSFSRDVSSDYAEQCTFDIAVTLTTCPAGQYCRASSSSACTCVAYETYTLPYTTSWVANDSVTESNFRVWIPERTARVSLKINNTDSSTYAYGNSRIAGGDYYYSCYESYTSAGTYYEINMDCYIPRPGWFYFYVYTYNTGYYLNGDVTVDIQTCPENMGGWNCSYAATNLTGSNGIALRKVITPGEGGSATMSTFADGLNYYFFTVTNGTEMTANLTFSLNSGSSSYVYWNNGGYIADGTTYYDAYTGLSVGTPQTVVLTWADFYAGGDIFIAVSNEGTTNTVDYNVTTSASSSGTTGSGTSGITGATTGSPNAAGAIVASFGLIAAVLAIFL